MSHLLESKGIWYSTFYSKRDIQSPDLDTISEGLGFSDNENVQEQRGDKPWTTSRVMK